MTDVVIVSAARTPVGAFNGALRHACRRTSWARSRSRRRSSAPRSTPDEVGRSHPGPGADRGRRARTRRGRRRSRPASRTSATAFGINQVCGSGLRAVALGLRRSAPATRHRGRRRRPGEHEPVAPRAPTCAAGTKMGDARADRHHDQGRAVGRLQRLPHGHHGRERRPASARSPASSRTSSPPRSQHKAEAAQKAGRFKDEIVPVTVKGRKGDTVVDHRRVHPRTAPRPRRWPSCGPPSPRTARSPPATPAASTTAPLRWC